jgi:hypothetical protein
LVSRSVPIGQCLERLLTPHKATLERTTASGVLDPPGVNTSVMWVGSSS